MSTALGPVGQLIAITRLLFPTDVIHQLATDPENNKYLSYLSENGSLLREKEGRDVIIYYLRSYKEVIQTSASFIGLMNTGCQL